VPTPLDKHRDVRPAMRTIGLFHLALRFDYYPRYTNIGMSDFLYLRLAELTKISSSNKVDSD